MIHHDLGCHAKLLGIFSPERFKATFVPGRRSLLATVETKVEANGHSPRKPTGRSRTH
jgi:hypothetical protein